MDASTSQTALVLCQPSWQSCWKLKFVLFFSCIVVKGQLSTDATSSSFLFFLEEVSFREAVIISSLCPLTVILNATVILVICKDPYKELWRTAANFFVLNLAVCDLLIGFPGELLFGLRHWFPDNPTLIQAGYFINHVAFLASILTILVLAVERLIVIVLPFTRVKLTTCNRYLCFMAIWLLALILALPTIIRWDLYLESISWGFNLICIPITILVFSCYTAIYVLVRRQLHLYVATSGERFLEGHYLTEDSCLVQKLRIKERSVAYTTFILVLVFTVCWVPLSIVVNINSWCSTCLCQYNWHYVVCLVFLHPLLNPIAYSLCTARFRKAFRRVIRKSTFWPVNQTMHP